MSTLVNTESITNSKQNFRNIITWFKTPAIYFFAAIAVGFSLLPFYIILTTALKVQSDIFSFPPAWIFNPTVENFQSAFGGAGGILKFLLNSVIVTVVSTVVTTAIGATAAYGLARSKTAASKHIAFYILSTRFAPPIAFIVPIFLLVRNAGLLDTHLALIILYTNLNLPLVIWVMRGFFKDIPVELEEAAFVDGYSRWQIFVRVALPLAKPGLTSIAILSAIFSWNEFLFASLLTQQNAATVPVYLSSFSGSIGINWGEYMAVGLFAVLPIILFTIFMQKHLVRGLSFGAVK